jgi:CheY-like chemotaxis protein
MSTKRILIVDDDPDMRLALRLPLESTGYTVAEARSVAEGLEAVKSFRPDLIVLDVMMDSTTAGFQLALEVHSPNPKSAYYEFRETPILVLTAIHSTTPLRFAPDEDYLPVQALLEKPIEPEALLAMVGKHLGKET